MPLYEKMLLFLLILNIVICISNALFFIELLYARMTHTMDYHYLC